MRFGTSRTQTDGFAARRILEEVEVPYHLQRVDLAAGEHQAADYLKINPNGVVPALVDGDGRAYFESAGRMILLCDRHPEAALAPPPLDPLRGRYY